jgi:hypothetical protein
VESRDNPSVPGLKRVAGAVARRARADAALSQRVESKRRSPSIDLSCGPRRDLKVFAELSRTALPSEGSARLGIMAHVSSGCEGCSRIPQARSVSLRSYKLQDNLCSQDCFETARHTANDDPTCVSKRIHAVPLNASSAVIAAMASFSKLRRASTLNSFQSLGKRRGAMRTR